MLELNKEGVRCFWREMTFRTRKVRYNVGTSWGKLRSRVHLEYPTTAFITIETGLTVRVR